MVVGPLAVAAACGGRSERLIGDDAGAGGESDGTGGTAGKGKGGSSGKGGTGGSAAAGGSGASGGTGGSFGGAGGTLPGKGGTGGTFPGKGGTGGTSPGKGGTGGTFPGKGGAGGFGGKAPVGGSAGFGGFGAIGGFGGFGGFGAIGGFGGFGGFGAIGGFGGFGGFGAIGGFGGSAGTGGSGGGDACGSNPPCAHGGECVETPEGAFCACPPDWHGATCQCRASDALVDGDCRLEGVCGFSAPASYGSGNCSSNTNEFADWWCQLAGYAAARSYQLLSANPYEALFYQDGSREVLSDCAQVRHTNSYFYGPNCTGVAELVCIGAPVRETLRPTVLVCGDTDRDISSYLPQGSGLNLAKGCSPDSSTQALLVPRSGIDQVSDDLRAYLHAGGVVLSEYGISDELFARVFPPPPAQPGELGSCLDNAPTTVQYSAGDRFWLDNPYQSIDESLTGCGFSVAGFPRLVPLAGWNASSVAIGYRNLGAGRFWAVDFDWADSEPQQTDYTRSLMGYMISHRR